MGEYHPSFIFNRSTESMTMLEALDQELATCETFHWAVAFITEGGLVTLKARLRDLARRGVRGRLITSTYLYFNAPSMFRELLKLRNVDVRITSREGFHAKGYGMKQKTHYSFLVGSANLTAQALKVNDEWNVRVLSSKEDAFVASFYKQFEEMWNESTDLTESWIDAYEKEHARFAPVDSSFVREEKETYGEEIIEPNEMQTVALKSLEALRKRGERRGLVISATGTGKTYLSAFDVRVARPKRMLFIVHREQILKQAMRDYERVIGSSGGTYGLYTGTTKATDATYVFATIQTLAREEHLKKFEPHAFDYIVIDEVHRSGAPSYRRVIDYFHPDFLLGMTATPERTDGWNVYELFGFNIAYEIRLHDALEERMLAPFHYIGVSDYEQNGIVIEEKSPINELVTSERVDHIVETLDYYGYDGDVLRGLIFCSRVAEAEGLARELTARGIRARSVSGQQSEEERAEAIHQLECGDIEYIISVDVFNEGVDIPTLNQIVMLRATESSIVFIQQLGRGLRKAPGKRYVTVIDFIGNYQSNFLIPIALSGDRSMNKDTIRRAVTDVRFLQGVSTIHFEEIAKERIYEAINKARLTTFTAVRDAYRALKEKIGRRPLLHDFIKYHSIDPIILVDEHDHPSKHKMESLYDVYLRMEEKVTSLSSYEQAVLKMVSKELIDGKRMHEVVLLYALLEGPIGISEYVEQLKERRLYVDAATIRSVERLLNLSFFTKSDFEKYGSRPIVEKLNETYGLNEAIQRSLVESPFFKELFLDVLHTAEARSVRYEVDRPLTLYEKYSRKDVCRLLNWDNDEKGTMYGYRLKHGTCPIFITYDKHEDKEATQQYEDAFVNEQRLHWFSRSNRTLRSKEVQEILRMKENGDVAHFFVKKDDGEGNHFYYLGDGELDETTVQEKMLADEPVVTMDFELTRPVEPALYNYLTRS